MHKEKEIAFGCNSLQELLDFAPLAVEDSDKIYHLNIVRGQSGYIVEYSFWEERIHVDLQGVKFSKTYNLFDTARRDPDLYKALASFLKLLHDNRVGLTFIPRIHPFNT